MNVPTREPAAMTRRKLLLRPMNSKLPHRALAASARAHLLIHF